MVAAIEQEQLTRQCSGPEEYFCRLIACEGHNASRAYKIAWKCKTTAPENRQQASRVMARPHVVAKLAELRAATNSAATGDMQERRRWLWDTIRARVSGKPSHGEKTTAIKLDAELAGEYRQEIGVGGEITVGHVLRGLGVGAVLPIAAEVVSVVADASEGPDGRSLIAQSGGVNAMDTESKPVGSSGPRTGADAILDAPPTAWDELE